MINKTYLIFMKRKKIHNNTKDILFPNRQTQTHTIKLKNQTGSKRKKK